MIPDHLTRLSPWTVSTARQCDGCTYCCWAFGIDDVPAPSGHLKRKPPLKRCIHACNGGCHIHAASTYPVQCKQFQCPYLTGDAIHRPDLFQPLLESLRGNAEGYIPWIPLTVPIDDALSLISSTRTLLAAITIDNRWRRMAVSIDKSSDGLWRTLPTAQVIPWLKLCYAHGAVFTMEAYA